MLNRLTRSPILFLLLLMLVMAVLNGRFLSPLDWLMDMVLMLPGIVIGLAFHEFGHAVVAYRLGDDTPELQGRVTLNPMAHIDPFGMLSLIVVGFGWGRPVQINPYHFKHPRRDEFLVGIAGVTVNLILAIITTGLIKVLVMLAPDFMGTGMGEAVNTVLMNVVLINIVLMVFNLLPVPPLDGFGLLTQLFDLRRMSWYDTVYQNGFIILMALLIFDVVDRILTPAVLFIYQAIVSVFF